MFTVKKGWCSLTNEAIEKIREAEKKAAETVAQAKTKAARIRAKAEADLADTEKELNAISAASIGEMTEKAKKKSARIVDDGESAARIEAKRLVAEAAKNTDRAAEEIVRRIIDRWQ